MTLFVVGAVLILIVLLVAGVGAAMERRHRQAVERRHRKLMAYTILVIVAVVLGLVASHQLGG